MPPIELIEPREIKPINATTYEVELLGHDKVEIGNRDALVFEPHIKLNRWDGECFIKVGLPTPKKITPILNAGKVKWVDRDTEAHLYPLEPRTVIAKDKEGRDHQFTQNELGGFEFEVILKKKPKTNKIVFDIETQGLKFYYQPPLTQEEIDDGSICPENVVGSYAVYHATRTPFHKSKADADKYKVGKAFHIYRPKITDALGNWVWGELSLDETAGILTTIIPQDFLDTAVYPISTGTTNFGHEGIGGKSASLDSYVRGTSYSCGGTGNALSMTFYGDGYSDPGDRALTALYRKSDHKPLEISSELNNKGLGWHTFTLLSNPALTAQDYVLCANSNDRWVIYYDSVTVYRYYKTSCWYSNLEDWPDPWDGTKGDAAYKYSIYCTYEAGGGVDVTVEPPLTAVTSEGKVPSMSLGLSLSSPLIAVDSQGHTPTMRLDRIFSSPLVSVDSEAPAPIFSLSPEILLPPLVAIDSEGLVPSLLTELVILPPLIAIDAEGLAPSLSLGLGLTIPLVGVDAEALTPSLLRDAIFGVPLATIDSEALVATIITPGGVTITVPLIGIDGQVLVPTLSLGTILQSPLVSIDSQAPTPIFSLSHTMEAPLVGIDSEALNPTLARDRIFSVPVVGIDSEALVASLSLGLTLDAPLIEIDTEALAASLSLGLSLASPLVAIDAEALAAGLALDRIFTVPVALMDAEALIPNFGRLGRLLVVKIITSQYRDLDIITTQKRAVKAITSLKRKARIITSGG